MEQKIIAYVTSIGEPTTELCVWSLERLGFEVVIVLNQESTLANKLAYIYQTADEDLIRVDADVIVNKNVLELIEQNELWWYQSQSYDWFKQDTTHGGIQFIRKECFPAIRNHINEIARLERPESYLSRLEEFHNPRRFGTFEKICGLHGYKQGNHNRARVMETKKRRNRYEEYDWDLSLELEKL